MDRRQYVHQFLALFSGTVLAQIFNLASYPLLARLYTPADFGLFGTFVAASAIPGAIACGRFDLVIATAPRQGRFAVLWLCFAISLAVAFAAAIVAALYWWRVDTPGIALMAPLLFLAVLLTGVTNATSMFLMRHDAFRIASGGVVVRTAATVLIQLALAFVWPSATSLILGFCFGLAAQAVLVLGTSARSSGLGHPRLGRMHAMFRRYRTQISVDIPSTLLAALSLNLMPFLLQFLYGVRAVGFYSVGQRIAVLPLQLFNDSLSQVFFQRAARAQEQRGEFWREFRFNLLSSGAISVVMLLGLLLLARPVVVLYLGEEWEQAATILVILAPMLAVRSVAMSIATTVFVLNRAVWLFYHNIASVAAMMLAFGVAWMTEAGLARFLELLALLQGIEFVIFAVLLGVSVRRASAASRPTPAVV